MFKSLSILSFFAVLALCLVQCWAAPVEIEGEEAAAMGSALKRGQALFGGAIPRNNKPKPENLDLGQESPVPKPKAHIHSIYTNGITSLGGGKPNRNDKYRVHNYTPLAPKVIPWSTGEKYNPEFISPEEAAQRFIPHNGYQLSTDDDLH